MSESDDLDALRERKREALLERAAGDPGPRLDGATSAPSDPVYVDSPAELDELTSTHRIVLADFYADWCGPCKMLEPTVRELARETAAAVAKVDVDAMPALAQRLRIQGVPTLFLYVDGEPVERLVGVQDFGTLASLVERHAA